MRVEKKLILIVGITIGIIYTYKTINQKNKTNNSVLSAETKKTKSLEKKAVDYAQSTFNNILGELTEVIKNTTSSVASKAEETVIKSAVSGIMNQVDKLPKEDKEKIKKEICK